MTLDEAVEEANNAIAEFDLVKAELDAVVNEALEAMAAVNKKLERAAELKARSKR